MSARQPMPDPGQRTWTRLCANSGCGKIFESGREEQRFCSEKCRQRQWNAEHPRRKPSKYRNQRTEVDGIKFASKREAARYSDLKLLASAGEIRFLTLQPRFDLVVTGVETVNCGRYIADFSYYRNGERIVEDVKSKPTMTSIYRLKKKLMKALHGIEIQEVF